MVFLIYYLDDIRQVIFKTSTTQYIEPYIESPSYIIQSKTKYLLSQLYNNSILKNIF